MALAGDSIDEACMSVALSWLVGCGAFTWSVLTIVKADVRCKMLIADVASEVKNSGFRANLFVVEPMSMLLLTTFELGQIRLPFECSHTVSLF